MNITPTVHAIGVNDRTTDLFESQYLIPNGISYNSYVILDRKVAVIDTVDAGFTHEWLDNLQAALGGRQPDYLVVQHMEPDHSASLALFKKAYPDTVIVATAKAFTMMCQFFGQDFSTNGIPVSEGDTLSLGEHTLRFLLAPMVHWPEVMVSYEEHEKLLFSADAFGKFGTPDTREPWVDEARRYYIGIVGKYGRQVQALLKKAAGLEIAQICPLHGPVLSENLGDYLSLYQTWSSYLPETDGIVVAYTSVYGNTRRAVEHLADRLRQSGCPQVVVHDLSRCDLSAAVADAFRYSKLVLATTTYNADIFPPMRRFIEALTERGYQNRTVALIENGSWAPLAARVMHGMLEKSQNLVFVGPEVRLLSAPNAESLAQIDTLANELCRDYLARQEATANKNDLNALFCLGYGLYVVTSKDGDRDNGLIVNTVSQVTSTPNRVSVVISKQNYSHHIIRQTGLMNVNCLSSDTPLQVFETFGFQSGRTVDKFAGCAAPRSDNGLVFLSKYINSFLSLKVSQYVDLDTHGMFLCEITEARVISDRPTMTYAYYQEHIKPKPQGAGKRGFVCKVCGYVYEGEALPQDFICPLCKHTAADFEPIADTEK